MMAVLQVIDKTDTTHNYTDKNVMGHKGRRNDSEIANWYTKSVFTEVAGEITATTSKEESVADTHSDVVTEDESVTDSINMEDILDSQE